MRPMHLELSIDALVLDGVDAGDRDRFAASLERELARLIDPRAPADVPDPAARSAPDALARQVAREVYGALAPALPPREP